MLSRLFPHEEEHQPLRPRHGQGGHGQQMDQEQGELLLPEQTGAHKVYPCRCLVLMKFSKPRAESFSRIRPMLTLSALSST